MGVSCPGRYICPMLAMSLFHFLFSHRFLTVCPLLLYLHVVVRWIMPSVHVSTAMQYPLMTPSHIRLLRTPGIVSYLFAGRARGAPVEVPIDFN
jgi:hypothetical protein